MVSRSSWFSHARAGGSRMRERHKNVVVASLRGGAHSSLARGLRRGWPPAPARAGWHSELLCASQSDDKATRRKVLYTDATHTNFVWPRARMRGALTLTAAGLASPRAGSELALSFAPRERERERETLRGSRNSQSRILARLRVDKTNLIRGSYECAPSFLCRRCSCRWGPPPGTHPSGGTLPPLRAPQPCLPRCARSCGRCAPRSSEA